AAALGAAGSTVSNREKRRSTFRLAINKNFGDTIMMNSSPEYVFARIIEHTPEGQDIPLDDLSQNITIFAGSEGIKVEPAGMNSGYQSAKVSAPFSDKTEAIVSFKFSYEMNSFTNNVIFKLAEPKVKFSQENIALPALYTEEEPLEFTVEGLDPEKTVIEAEMSENSSYEVNIATTDEQAKKGLYMAMIRDVNKNEGVPGTYDENVLRIKASDGKTTAYGQIKINRITEGLYIALEALNCYGVLKDGAQKNEAGVYPAESYVSASTEAKAWLMLVDMESQQVVQMSVSPKVTFTSTRPPDLTEQSAEEWAQSEQETIQIENLGILMYVSDRSEGVSTCKFFCGSGFLRAPARLYAFMEAEVEYGEGEEKRVFKCKKQVLLRSQPRRAAATNAERAAFDKNDKEITEKLEKIMDYVDRNTYNQDLAWIYDQAYLHWVGYDYEYGYDIEQVNLVFDMFRLWYDNNVMAYRERAQKLANNYAANYSYYDAVMDTYRERSHTIPGIAARIIVAVASGGGSEFVFVPMDVQAAVHKYNKERLPEERTTLGQFTAGSIPVLWAVAFACLPGAAKQVFKAGKYVCGKALSGLGKVVVPMGKWAYKMLPAGAKALTNKLGQYVTKNLEKVKLLDPRKLWKKWNGAANETNASTAKASGSAWDDIMKMRQKGANTLEEQLLQLGDDAASLNGFKTVNKLAQEMKELGKNGKTLESLKPRILEIMNDPQALEQLNKMAGPKGIELRKIFNAVQEGYVYKPTREKTLKLLAQRYGKDPSKLRFKNVSSNADDALFNGEKIGHDLDVTVEELVNGKWVSLKQHEVMECYHQAFCESNGLSFASGAEAVAKSESFQQHVCQSLEDLEFLPEYEKLIYKSRAGEAINECVIDRVKFTLKYKAQHAYDEGAKLCESFTKAEKEQILKELQKHLTDHGTTGQLAEFSANTRKYLQGIALKKEGIRCGAKSYNQLLWKDTAAMSRGCQSSVSLETHKAGQLSFQLTEQTEKHINLFEYEGALTANGTSYSRFAEGTAEAVGKANAGLQLSFKKL
ncbi:MAG: hypothetical protein J6X60_00890, partial [Ruminiclostridium sp.]|nr:hypothetical protein [Ruminiclostridium sp.]